MLKVSIWARGSRSPRCITQSEWVWVISLLPSHPRIPRLPSKTLLMFSNPTQLCSPNINSWDEEIWGFSSRVPELDEISVGNVLCTQVNSLILAILQYLSFFNAVFVNPADWCLLWTPSYPTHSWFITNQLLFLHPSWDQLYLLLLSAVHLCCWHPLLSLSWFRFQQEAHLPLFSIQYLSNALWWEYWSWQDFPCMSTWVTRSTM